MLKAFKVSSVIIVALLLLMISVSCGSTGPAPSGELPTWHVGDTWTTKSVIFGYEDTFVYTVTGEQIYNGIDCYNVTAQTTMNGFTDTYIQAYDKSTLSLRSVMGPTLITNTLCNYSVKKYPLSLGKTWTDIGTTTTFLSGGNQTTQTYNYTYKVESIERITVPAGTFHCFKVVWYDSNDSMIGTEWLTDVTRGVPVKQSVPISVGNVTSSQTTIEMTSYSFSK